MIAPIRFLAWLLLPALMSCSFNLLAATAEGAPQALHLLDYIGADYPPTVEAGKVIDESEYREQVEFLGVLQGLVAELPQRPERAELVKGVDELSAAVSAHQDGATVARQARQLGAKLAVAYEVSQAPAITPDPARGAPLYAQHCSVCHGTAGAGDGPASTGMTPPPANLRDAVRLDRLSLYAIYNTLGLGVEGTDMPSFADQLDDRQRWDLATYIAGFTADPLPPKVNSRSTSPTWRAKPPTRCWQPVAQPLPRRSAPSVRSRRRSSVARRSCSTTPRPRWTRASPRSATAITNRPMTFRSQRTWKALSW